MAHLSAEELLDVAEGRGTGPSAGHLATCHVCRASVADLQKVIAAVTSADVPEPSPLFWDHLSARVREGIAAEESSGRTRRPAWWASWRLAACGGLAAAAVAVVLMMRPSPDFTVSGPSAGSALANAEPSVADSQLASIADDVPLGLLGDLAGDLDWDGAAEAGITMRAGAADGMLTDLSEDERVELRRLLKEEMGDAGA